MKGSKGAAGQDLYAIEDQMIPAKGKQVFKTGRSLRLRNGTNGRIAPRSRLAVKQGITANAGVLNLDDTGNRRSPSQSLQLKLSNTSSRQNTVETGIIGPRKMGLI